MSRASSLAPDSAAREKWSFPGVSMSKSLLRACLSTAIAATLLVAGASAQQVPKGDPKSDARAAIAKKFPGLKAEDVRPSAVPGMFEVALGADTVYVSADGKYLIAGDLYEVETRNNLTESGRADLRRKVFAEVDERDMIIFAPAKTKHTITVFTDVDCGYCRKLHGEIEELNKLGVRVRYMAYPRSGPGTEDWSKMEAVWCAKDRKAAITQAKRGEPLKSAECGATPVAKQYELGEEVGVRGTPAIYTARGDYIGGYLTPDKMLETLESRDKGDKK
jgi:thiol:disulfide interchange protein DsbC